MSYELLFWKINCREHEYREVDRIVSVCRNKCFMLIQTTPCYERCSYVAHKILLYGLLLFWQATAVLDEYWLCQRSMHDLQPSIPSMWHTYYESILLLHVQSRKTWFFCRNSVGYFRNDVSDVQSSVTKHIHKHYDVFVLLLRSQFSTAWLWTTVQNSQGVMSSIKLTT